MTSNWYAENSVCDSQNFKLRFSGSSSIEDSSPQRFVTNEKMEDDVIVISDSSCSSSPVYIDNSKYKSSLSSGRSKEYQKLDFLEISSSEKERESDLSWESIGFDNKFSKKNSRAGVQIIKTPTKLISNDTLLTSDNALINNETAISSNVNYDRNRNKSKRCINDKNPTLITEQETNSKLKEYNTEKINRMIKPSCAVYNNSPNVLSRHLTYNTPTYTKKQDGTRLTKKDAYNILKNIKVTQVVYNSPRKKKEVNVIINESTDIDEDIMHPAISPHYNKKVQHSSDNPDVINTSIKNDTLQTNLSKSPKSNINVSRIMDSFRPLSERRKKQIREWLLTNVSDSQSDNSFNTIPPSTRNSNSGNSSLERLELNYETPNNRGKINKKQTDEKQRTIMNSDRVINSFSFNTISPSRNRNSGNSSLGKLELNYETPNNRGRINKVQTDEKQKTIMNSDRVINSCLTHQNIMDEYFKKSKSNSEFCTPTNKPKFLPKAQIDEKASSVANTLEIKNVKDCADILDKLYGATWRDKANLLLPTTEPRKTSVQTVNRIVQTERKSISKDQYRTVGSDSDEFDLVKDNIKPNRKKAIQRKQKKMDYFINDESLSGSDSESMYHTALTNPTTFTSNSIKSAPASIRRLQMICDTDTDDGDDKSSDNSKNLRGRKLSFSDDESSSTSEFDPGDYIPPKYIHNKDVVKRPISPKTAPKFESTMTKPVRHKTFLTSLSSTVPISQVHQNAKKYRLDYKNYKQELCKMLYELYNEKVFDNKLPQYMPIEWNVRMRGTAGYCYNKKSVKSFSGSVVKSSRIVLATKVLDTPDRLRDTLIHEMCHAASWIINDVSDGHGPFWTKWASKAMKTFPELPPIRRCHNYEIKTKFTYKCTSCGYSIGRHSKSLDVEKKRCGYCYGKFELLINKTSRSGTLQQVQTPKREPTGFALYVKQNYNSVKKEKNNMKHADVMKLLGQQFSAIKIAKKTDVANG